MVFAALRRVRRRLRGAPGFPGSARYWEERYRQGGDSGVGSSGKFAEFKAEFLNRFVVEHQVASVVEFGCGDGNQLALARYPRYLGVDVSAAAIDRCRERFAADPTKRFQLLSEYCGERAELSLSLDVLFHLVEDAVYERYLRTLFDAAQRFVVVYSSNFNESTEDPHVRHRDFGSWVARHRPEWTLFAHVPNRYPYQGDYLTGSFADFYCFARQT